MKTNQKGFTVVESLLAIIAITLIAGVVFFVVNANKNTDQSNSNQSKASESTTKTKDNLAADTKTAKDLAVPDLGIKLTLSGVLSGLKFNSSSEPGGVMVDFYSDALDTIIKECKGNATTPYTVATVVKYPGEYGANNGPRNAYMDFIKQLDGAYLEIGSPDGGIGCADESKSEVVGKKYLELNTALKEAIKNAEEIKN